MSKWENFTAGRVEAFTCQSGKKQSIYWDGKTPGLGLRVTAAGSKSYIFETQLTGKTLRTTIGDAKTWTVAKAQAEATRLKTMTDQGEDPRQVKAEQRAATEAAQAETRREVVKVGEAWTAYLEARRAKWSERSMSDHLSLCRAGGEPKTRGRKNGEGDTTSPGPLAPLMLLKLSDLTPERVKVWLLDEAAKRPTQADNAFVRLRAFLNWCAEHPDYASAANPDACNAKRVKEARPTKNSKDDCLQREQLQTWFDSVRTIGNPVIAAYLQGLLLTGARREELMSLKWTDVDFQWKSLHLADKVEETGRTIPLTPFVAALLAALPHRNEWVFSSPTAASGRLQDPSGAHVKAVAAAGLPALSLHGLRRSFGTLSEWVECPVGVVAQIQGHKPSAIAEKHYRRRPLDLLRMWHEKIEAWILNEAGIQFDAGQNAAGLCVVNS